MLALLKLMTAVLQIYARDLLDLTVRLDRPGLTQVELLPVPFSDFLGNG